ncbi:MAG: ABC transporter ATP-binding protein [Chloroflexota bacterium]|nr:MAG: ABC transporter ATP-binding protein [Chloroflexota bacterium]
MIPEKPRNLIEIQDLKTYFNTLDGEVRAVDGVSLEIKPGETLGLVGESGCGKSVTAYSILRLLPKKKARIVHGKILYDRGSDATRIDMATLDPNGDVIRSIRGNEIAMIFQEPLTSLSPVHTVGSQIAEAVQLHQQVGEAEARSRAIKMLEAVGIATPIQRYDEYPHQFSGGMRQRAMIAMALSCNPRLLIADEPTTALDVTIQAQILELMKSLQKEFGMAILMITHNLGVIAEISDRVAVMYMGKIVEMGPVRSIFRAPLHPYTVGLMRSIPRLGRRVKERLTPIPGCVPDPFSVPPGCAFCTRCPAMKPDCQDANIPLFEAEQGHWVRCKRYLPDQEARA